MSQLIEVNVPDIGDFKDVPVIEVHVKPGDTVREEDPLVTLESDKATMDVPSPAAGVVREVKVAVGDKLSEGMPVLVLEAASGGEAEAAPSGAPEAAAATGNRTAENRNVEPSEEGVPPPAQPSLTPLPTPAEVAQEVSPGQKAHASPSVRRYARELGVDVSNVSGTGPKGRILREDVQVWVKQALTAPRPTQAAGAGGAVGGLELLPWPQVDFAKFGAIETRPLARIRKISGANLARNWVMIPHVTQFDEADITELETFRIQVNREREKEGVKLTLLGFLIKACVAALKRFPEFNSSLDGDNLVLKRYFHIGFAADTPNGLVVPVLRDADGKGVIEIARESSALAARAREGKLAPAEMQGGTFTVSSLGGIGGTAFTPIINAPEVAILGVSRSVTKPVWDGAQFAPRLVLPLSLSYDHRVIDGAAGARFTAHLRQLLADFRRVML